MKHLLSYDVGIKNKFGYILEEDENEDDSNNNKSDSDNSEDFEDDMINNGIDDL